MEKAIKGIYLIERIGQFPENEERRFYVGQAIDVFRRLNQHCTGKSPGIDNALSELGADKFSFRILEKVRRAKDLDACERKWIEHYRKQYGDGRMYNIAQTANARNGMDKEVRKKIKGLFTEDIGRSIYAIAEHFDVSYDDVIAIRKPLLKPKGLMWKNRRIIDIQTGMAPEDWRGGVLTKKLADRVNKILAEPGMTEKDITKFISKSDWLVYQESIKSGKEYKYAPPIDGH